MYVAFVCAVMGDQLFTEYRIALLFYTLQSTYFLCNLECTFFAPVKRTFYEDWKENVLQLATPTQISLIENRLAQYKGLPGIPGGITGGECGEKQRFYSLEY
jgi:hypothetical protein